MRKDQQLLVNEWHWLSRDQSPENEDRMAQIEARLADVNPAEHRPDKDWQPPSNEPLKPEELYTPEKLASLTEQDRKNLEAFWGKR